MPLVYVHGIGNRPGQDWHRRGEVRDGLFRKFLLPAIDRSPADALIRSPMWGVHGGHLRWGGASLPTGSAERLGGELAGNEVVDDVVATERASQPDRLLCEIATRDLADVVDLLFTVSPIDAGEHPGAAPAVSAADQLVAYCRVREDLYPENDQTKRYPWLHEVRTDNELVDRLWQESGGWSLDQNGQPIRSAPTPESTELLGARDLIRRWFGIGLDRLRRATVGLPATAAAVTSRAVAARRVSTLAGDVLSYIAGRGSPQSPGAIVRTVTDALDEAATQRAADQPLVVVAHSMGGNIVYDSLTHFRPDLPVDVFVTVGSQVGLFEELKLFGASDPGIPAADRPRVTVPANIRQWINVVDSSDILGYRADPVFDRVTDYRYPSGALWAHGAYFRQPRFHDRLASRVRQVLP